MVMCFWLWICDVFCYWNYSYLISFVCYLNSELDTFSWSAKPGFFHEESRANLFEVEPQSGMLINTDNGTPMAQVWFNELWHLFTVFHMLILLKWSLWIFWKVGDPSPKFLLKSKDKGCRVFQGGNVGHLHSLLSIESSSQVVRISYFSNKILLALD